MVTATALTTYAGYNASGQSSWTTSASITPTAGRFVIITVTSGTSSSTNPNIPTVSGCNMTWTYVNGYLNAIGLSRRISVFRGVAVSPTNGAITADFAGQNQVGCTIEVAEMSGIDTTGTNGSNGIVQSVAEIVAGSATSKTITLATLAKTDNVTFGCCMAWGYGTAISPGSGYTELNDTVNTVGSQTQMQIKLPLGSTTVNWTFADANDNETGAVALELKTLPDTGGLILTIF
jgi:hypothetical protein